MPSKMVTFNCANCLSDFKRPYRRDRINQETCSRKCRSELDKKRRTVDCEHCGVSFEKRNYNQRFCTQSCLGSHSSENRFESGTWSKQEDSEIKKCRVCSKPSGKTVFCKSCWEKRKSMNNVDGGLKKRPKQGLFTNSCLYCGDKYESKSAKKSFCSEKCSSKFDDFVKPTGELNSECKSCFSPISSCYTWCSDCAENLSEKIKRPDMTIGELKEKFPYPAWRKKTSLQGRKTVRDTPNKCHHCEYDKHVEVCHIKPVQDFPSDAMYISEINAPQNLLKLCPNHHWEMDYGDLSVRDLFDLELA